MSRAPNHQRMLGNVHDLVTAIRPDWSSGETRSILDNAYRDRHAIGVIAAAAIDTAMTGNAMPEAITARLAEGWGPRGWAKNAIQEARAPLPHGQAYHRCGRCGKELIGGETRETHAPYCRPAGEPRALSQTRTAAQAEARRVAAEAKANA